MAGELFDKESADAYLQKYSDTGVNIGYAISEGAVLSILGPFLGKYQKSGQIAQVLEVGAGPGRSTFRMVDELRRRGVNDFALVSTEINGDFIDASMNARNIRVVYPHVQMAAESMAFPAGLFDFVMGSQVIH